MFTIAFDLQPPGSPYHFFGSRWALAIMNPFLQATQPGVGAQYWGSVRSTSPETLALVTMLDQIWLQLLEVCVTDLGRFYGLEAPIFEVARLNLKAKRKGKMIMKDAPTTDPEGSGTKRGSLLVINVNRLWEWAGLPCRSWEEITG
tara:strand:- start:904 stop:1341 length:438 start_codon:yes stop_codon:yes gene_type:complete